MNKAVRTARTGFTLIELLVVIAIIAILAAILFPVFAKAREKARQTSCLSQSKQIGLAILQYLDNYDEKLPAGTGMATGVTPVYTTSTPTNAAVGQGYGWAGQIYPQVKSVGIYKCPDDSTSNGTVAGGYSPVPLSYAYNSNVAGITQAQFGNVAKSIMVYEIQGVTMDPTPTAITPENYSPASNGTSTFIPPTTPVANSGSYTPGVAYATGIMQGSGSTVGTATGNAIAQTGRHSDGSNFLLADGHSKWFRQSAVSTGNNATNTTDQGNFGQGGQNEAAGTGYSAPQMGATFSAL